MAKRTHFSLFAYLIGAAALVAGLAMTNAQPQFRSTGELGGYSINVKNFGAITDDRRDDTPAIQAAIDSLPVPNHAGPRGGVVFFPRGTYNVTSLRLPPAVQLVGEGEATYLVGRGEAPTIALWSPFGHGFVTGAVVRDLKIFSPESECIGIDRKTVSQGNVVNCRFQNLHLRSGKGRFAILLDIYSQDCELRDINVTNYGGGAVHIFGNENLIERVNTEGSDDDREFAAEPARLVVRGGGNTITGCIIESGTRPAVAVYVEGAFTWINNWIEVRNPKDGIAYHFKNCWGQIDDLKLLGETYKVKMENCQMMQIGRLDVRSGGLANTFILDDKSNVVVDLVATQMDCGWLDHERFKIKRIWNEHANVILDNPPATRGINFVEANPNARSAGSSAWMVQDPMNQPGEKAEFDVAHETNSLGEHVLRVDVKANPSRHNLSVRVPLTVPSDLIGKRGVLQVTLDPKIMVWSKDFKSNYPIRISGERTMCITPALEANDEVNFVIDAPEAGKSVRISGLSVTK